MKPRFSLPAAFCLALLTFGSLRPAAAQDESARFPHPDRIHYDSQCLTIDGKDTFIYSGAFHYFRCPKELWRDRFEKIRAAGFNCVESYVAWNWHEPEMPSGINDFSKVNMRELDEWLTMAEEFGLYVIIRPGPYICAEWDTGGFPQWLLAKKPATPLRSEQWLRTDDPVYLAWCKHWYDAACPIIAKHQITRHRPGQTGVILFQLENEYNFPQLPDEVKRSQVRALAQYARADGVDIPLFTCLTSAIRGQTDPLLQQIFDTCNFYPLWKVDGIDQDIRNLHKDQPWAPLMTTELQGGWFANVGGKLSEEQDGVTPSQINNLTQFALQHGETALNYYMLFGGSNFGDHGARNMITSYDYNAPIREPGGTSERYQRVWALGHMLREHGPKLLRAEAVKCEVTKPQDDVSVVMRRAPDGSRYLFVRTSQHTEPRQGTAHVKAADSPELVFDYNLEPFGATILYLPPGVTDAAQGQWLPAPAPAVERPTNLPQPVVMTQTLRRDDAGPAHWMPWHPGQTFEKSGILDDRFVFYRSRIDATQPTLALDARPDDPILAVINGTPLSPAAAHGSITLFDLQGGSTNLLLLYENPGHANFGDEIEELSGIRDAHLLPHGSQLGETPVKGWVMRQVNTTEPGAEIAPDFNDDDWSNIAVNKLDANNLPSFTTGVFRARVILSAEQLNGSQVRFAVGRIDDVGTVYINGHKVGRTDSWSRPYSFDVTAELHAGTNSIAVLVRNNEGKGGLGLPALEFQPGMDSPSVPLEMSGESEGMAGKWWQPRLNDAKWETTAVGQPGAGTPSPALLTWHRMKFELPKPTHGVWVPWKLRLTAGGNGYLYLNGHALGRYWQVGPQHDFFLPECWLKFGPGKENVIALCERPVKGDTAIQQAEVLPYAEFAEFRK